ncbi:MAG: TrkA C-terminal domain-containing protein [Chloroflexota bacterium]
MIELLNQNGLLALFVVMTIGIGFGRIRIWGIQLGVSAVLFAGLFVGALATELVVPAFISQLGLIIFLYAIGLSNGANFFRSLQNNRNRQLEFILFSLTLPMVLIIGAALLLGLSDEQAAGIYSGAETNTAALAALIDLITASYPLAELDQSLTAVVVGYSLAYPAGVLCRLIPISMMERFWRIDYQAEAYALRDVYPVGHEIVNRAILVTNKEMTNRSLRELQRVHRWDVVFGRLYQGETAVLSTGDTQLSLGDVIIIVGEQEKADQAVADMGENAAEQFLIDTSVYVKRRLFVSNPNSVGQPLAALDLKEKHGALVTRVRRGDIDVVANQETILELGDRVRVLAPRDEMPRLVDLFGDSYVAVSQVNLLPFGLGIAIGLLLGTITFSLPTSGFAFRLGFAGGPLVVALILGSLRRTGPIVWTLPYSANQTLQQVGLILLLAGIGLGSGGTLAESFQGSEALTVLGTAVVIVFFDMLMSLFIGYKLFKIPFSLLVGMLSSQPAVLGYVSEKAQTALPQIGFSSALPLNIILKVAYAQILLIILSRF